MNGHRRFAAIAALTAVWGAACAPTEETADGDTLKVLAYNIHHGEGMDSIVDLERIAGLIRDLDVDVVTLQEVDSVTRRTGLVDQTRALADLTGMSAAFGRFMDYDGGAYGMAVLARWPMVDATNWTLPDGPEPRSALAVRVRSPLSGREAIVVGIHFYGSPEERLIQAATLQDHLRGETTPIVLAGDFNSSPNSEVMDRIALGWTVLPKGEDHFTFPSYEPDREIDFIVYRPAEAFELIDQRVIDEPVISDHRPLLATIRLH
ncbi:MAG: endonuclease/exonuclease/phosphatase family protein [Gemmatimonadota bacterium]|nr:endonuclease/exonuclease/phosphatase family protein [Gemmatimonadota bacterium]